MQKLPLGIEVSIRDHYEKQDTPFAILLAAASKDFGFHVDAPIDWVRLWQALGPSFKEAYTEFVPSILAVVLAAIEAILQICAEDDTWADSLIDAVRDQKLLTDGALHLFVYANDAKADGWLPHVAWVSNAQSRGFVMSVSTASGIALKNVKPEDMISHIKSAFEARTWDAEIVAARHSALTSPTNTESERPRTDGFPRVEDLPKPADLLESATPYICIVKADKGVISVECSHEKTILLVAEYLEKWMKKDLHISPTQPMGRVELVETSFGKERRYDTLRVKPFHGHSYLPLAFNAMLPLALLQGSLGYQIMRSDGCTTLLKRDLPFS